MLKKLTLMLATLLSLVLATSAVSAQDPSEVIDPTDTEGYESAYSRVYSPSMDESSSPEAGIDLASMMKAVTLIGVTFDSDDNAEAYLENLKSSVDEMANSGNSDMEMEISEPDYGDRAYSLSVDMSEYEMGTSMTAIQVDNVVFITQAFSSSVDEAQAMVQPFIDHLMDNDVSDDEVAFSEDGTSTGGVFGAFPSAEDTDVIGDLTNIVDADANNPSTPSM